MTVTVALILDLGREEFEEASDDEYCAYFKEPCENEVVIKLVPEGEQQQEEEQETTGTDEEKTNKVMGHVRKKQKNASC